MAEFNLFRTKLFGEQYVQYVKHPVKLFAIKIMSSLYFNYNRLQKINKIVKLLQQLLCIYIYSIVHDSIL